MFMPAAVRTSMVPGASAAAAFWNVNARVLSEHPPPVGGSDRRTEPEEGEGRGATSANAKVKKALASAIGSTFGQMCQG